MSEFIKLKQVTGGLVTANDDRIIYDLNNGTGVIRGIEPTSTRTGIHISAGYGMIKGGLFEVEDHDISVPTAHGNYQIILTVDYSLSDPVYISAKPETYQPVQNEDINFGGGIYEIVICTYSRTSFGVTSIDFVAPKIVPVSELVPFRLGIDEDGNYGYYKAGADTVTPFKSGGRDISGTSYSFSIGSESSTACTIILYMPKGGTLKKTANSYVPFTAAVGTDPSNFTQFGWNNTVAGSTITISDQTPWVRIQWRNAAGTSYAASTITVTHA